MHLTSTLVPRFPASPLSFALAAGFLKGRIRRNPSEIPHLPPLVGAAPNLPFRCLPCPSRDLPCSSCRPELPCLTQLDGSSARFSPGVAPSAPTRNNRLIPPVRLGRPLLPIRSSSWRRREMKSHSPSVTARMSPGSPFPS